MRRVCLAAAGIMCAVLLAGCPSTSNPGSTVDLTIGGDPVTGYLKTGDVKWYRFEITEDYVGERVDVIMRNVNQVPVGVIMRMFCSGDKKRGDLALEWEMDIPPANTYQQLTDENMEIDVAKAGAEKAREIPAFLIPRKGFYYISVEGYQFLDGKRPANDYQYRDMLAYTLGVRFTPKPGLADGLAIVPQPQAAGVPFVSGFLRPGDVAYHPTSLNKDTVYQAQVLNEGEVDWYIYRRAPEKAMVMNNFFTLEEDTGQFYMVVANPSFEDFGYVGYRARVYIDDHGMDAETATALPLANGTTAGYLTNGDTDWFSLSFPPNTGANYVKYSVELDCGNTALRIAGAGSPIVFNESTGRYTLVVTRPPSATRFEDDLSATLDETHVFTVEEVEPAGLIDGFGGYNVTVSVTTEEFAVPAAQAANVPFIEGNLRGDDPVYLPLSLVAEKAYYLQTDLTGVGYAVVDTEERVVRNEEGYFKVAEDGAYFLRITGWPLSPFRARVLRDDHGMDADTATRLQPVTAAVSGYFGPRDTDYFTFVFPANEGAEALEYTLEIPANESLNFSGLSFDSERQVYSIVLTQAPGALEVLRTFTVSPVDAGGIDGAGAYSFSVTRL